MVDNRWDDVKYWIDDTLDEGLMFCVTISSCQRCQCTCLLIIIKIQYQIGNIGHTAGNSHHYAAAITYSTSYPLSNLVTFIIRRLTEIFIQVTWVYQNLSICHQSQAPYIFIRESASFSMLKKRGGILFLLSCNGW